MWELARQIWLEVLSPLGALAFIAWAVKSLADFFFDKKKEDYRKGLEHAAFVFSKLHETRNEVIAKLFHALCVAVESLGEAQCTADEGDRYRDCAAKALDDTQQVRQLAQSNRIYFPTAVQQQVDGFITQIRNAAEVHSIQSATTFFQVPDAEEVFRNADLVMSEILPLIERDFKRLLGVEE